MRADPILCLALCVALAPVAARADSCADTEASLRAELALRFEGPDDPGTLARRDRLDMLFARAPADCAKALHEQLGETATGDELSDQFHRALATPTRAKLRQRLRDVYEPYDTLDAAIEANVSGAAEREHLECWVEKLRRGDATDPRVLSWANICPQDEQSCSSREHPTDAELGAIASKSDVEDAAPATLRIFEFLDVAIDLARIGDVDAALANLRENRRQAAEAAQRLAADDLPPHYAALAEWLAQQDGDPNSVLWCPRPMP